MLRGSATVLLRFDDVSGCLRRAERRREGEMQAGDNDERAGRCVQSPCPGHCRRWSRVTHCSSCRPHLLPLGSRSPGPPRCPPLALGSPLLPVRGDPGRLRTLGAAAGAGPAWGRGVQMGLGGRVLFLKRLIRFSLCPYVFP